MKTGMAGHDKRNLEKTSTSIDPQLTGRVMDYQMQRSPMLRKRRSSEKTGENTSAMVGELSAVEIEASGTPRQN